MVEVGEEAGAKPDLVHVRVEHQLEVGRFPPHGDQVAERVHQHLVDEGLDDFGDRLPDGPLEPCDAREVAQPFQQVMGVGYRRRPWRIHDGRTSLSMSGRNSDVKPAGFHTSKRISASSLSRRRIENIRAVPFSNKNHPMPAPIPSSIYRDNRIGFNRAPLAEWPFLGFYSEILKGSPQLIMSGVRFFICRQKNTLLEISLRLQIRLTSYHSHAGNSTSGFILLYHTFHL